MEDAEQLEIISKKDRKQHIWVEKYRPKKLDDYLGNDTIKETFAIYVKNQDIPNLLLYSGPGTGKSGKDHRPFRDGAPGIPQRLGMDPLYAPRRPGSP